MPWSRINTDCSIHWVQHTPSTAHIEYCIHRILHHPKIDCLPLPASLSALSRPCCTQFSTFPRLRVKQWIESQLLSHLPPNLPPSDQLPPSTPRILIDHGLQVQLQTRSITASKCISEILDLGLQMHLQTCSITASKCISEFHDLGLQVHLQTRSIMASKCISKHILSRPPSASLSYSISAFKCMSNHALSRAPSASRSYTISASKCISKLSQSWPPSSSLSSTWSRPPSASLSYSISSSQCFSNLAQSRPPSASLGSSISASKCIPKLAPSQPPSAPLTSTWFWPPSASLIVLATVPNCRVGTEPLQWVLPHENLDCCHWAGFTTKNTALQVHNFRSNQVFHFWSYRDMISR